MESPKYHIDVKYFEDLTPFVSLPIYPEAKLYEETSSSSYLNLVEAKPTYTWNICTKGRVDVAEGNSFTPNPTQLLGRIELTTTFVLATDLVIKATIVSGEIKSCTNLLNYSQRVLKMVEGHELNPQHKRSLTVYSHNILADKYITKNAKESWVHRLNHTIRDIESLGNPDVILLQEVEDHFYNTHLKIKLPAYDLYFEPKKFQIQPPSLKFPDAEDGLCIGVKKGVFSNTDYQVINFNTEWQNLGNKHNLNRKVYNKPNVSNMVILEDAKTNKNILIANVHFSALESRARMFQAANLMNRIIKHPKYSKNTAIIIGGDFNAHPNRDAMAAMKKGNVAKFTNDIYAPYSELNAVQPLKFIKMRSAYQAIIPKDHNGELLCKDNNTQEPYTFFKAKECVATKDYFLFENASCIGALQMLSERRLMVSVFPSDHISVAAKFKY